MKGVRGEGYRFREVRKSREAKVEKSEKGSRC